MLNVICFDYSTGATGYIGGSVFDTLVKTHPEYEVSALLRNVPANFKELYPNVAIVHGDYDNEKVLSDAASKADVVVRKSTIPSLLVLRQY
jgi:uncharacterized protein YbjT (DUF2867 family)